MIDVMVLGIIGVSFTSFVAMAGGFPVNLLCGREKLGLQFGQSAVGIDPGISRCRLRSSAVGMRLVMRLWFRMRQFWQPL